MARAFSFTGQGAFDGACLSFWRGSAKQNQEQQLLAKPMASAALWQGSGDDKWNLQDYQRVNGPSGRGLAKPPGTTRSLC